MNADRESFRKIGLTFEEKAFYDILMALRDEYNFEYGTDKVVDGVMVNDKCKALAKKIKEIIDTKSSFADWLNNKIVRDQLKFDIKVCLIKNGYPPQYSPEVFRKVMEQVENFEENNCCDYEKDELHMYQTNEYIDFLHHELVSGFCPEQHAHPDNALQFLGKQCRRKYQAKSAPMPKQIASVHPQCFVPLLPHGVKM